VTLWQKMATATRGKTPPQFLSTHPSAENRIAELERLQGVVQPLYLAANQRTTYPVPPVSPLDMMSERMPASAVADAPVNPYD
jgi:hypothetical protein